MISTTKALELILSHTPTGKPTMVTLEKSVRRVLADSVYSTIYSPAFNQSAMDGYAIRFTDLDAESLTIAGEVITGSAATKVVKPGNCIRIFTGAMLPKGADTVVVVENTSQKGDKLFITDKSIVKKGSNIRLNGAQIKPGEQAFTQNQVLTPAAVGFLAMLGKTKTKVYNLPDIAIIATGSELKKPGTKLKAGEIYESNTYTLIAALQDMNLKPVSVAKARDTDKTIKTAIQKAMRKADVILLTGGISAGNYDLVAPVLASLGVKKVFHKVAQKPGKPFYFGVKGKKLFFALPGNPSSVLTCFYEYVYPSLRKWCGHTQLQLRSAELPLKKPFEKKGSLTQFLKGYADTTGVELMQGQESFLLNSFATANCLVLIPAEKNQLDTGEKVWVHFTDPF